jgi:hypothetical protein
MHAWDKSEGPGKAKLSRVLSIAAMLVAFAALVLAVKKPQPVAPRQTPADVTANAQSFQNKVQKLEESKARGESGAEVRLTTAELNAAIAQASSTIPVPQQAAAQAQPQTTPAGQVSSSADPNAPISPGAIDMNSLQEPIISFDGDIVHGQFLTEVAGKKVYVTVSGHLASKDGYATFEPTEFKVGDLNVPVSLVNPELQKKMLEQRDRLKLPEFVSDVHVENGELVVKQK